MNKCSVMVSRTVLLVTLTMLFTFACCLSSSSSAVVKTSIRNKRSGRWNRLFNQTSWINRIARRITPAIKSTANKINIIKPKFAYGSADEIPEIEDFLDSIDVEQILED